MPHRESNKCLPGKFIMILISPDWPLANAESPVPHPLKNGEVFTVH